MTYRAHNKCDLFRRIISFCNNLLPNYQNLCPRCNNGLDVMQGCHLGERGLEGSTDPQGFTILIFPPVNRTFETVLPLQNQYVTQT